MNKLPLQGLNPLAIDQAVAGLVAPSPAAAGKPAKPARAGRRRPEDDPRQAALPGELSPEELAALAEEEAAAAEEVEQTAEGEPADPYAELEEELAVSDPWAPVEGEQIKVAQAQEGGGAGAGAGAGGGAAGAGAGGLGVGAAALGIPPAAIVAGAALAVGAAVGGSDSGSPGGGAAAPGPVLTAFAAINPALTPLAPLSIPTGMDAYSFYIGNAAGVGDNIGFARSVAPGTLAGLGSRGIYDIMAVGSNGTTATTAFDTISYLGVEFDLSAGWDVYAQVSAYASGSDQSYLIWLANLGAVLSGDASTSADAYFDITADAFNGGDAEVGISNLYIDIAGTRSVAGGMNLSAYAHNTDTSMAGSVARVVVGNDLEILVSGQTAYAYIDSISANAETGTSNYAEVRLLAGINIEAAASVSAYAYIGNISADASSAGFAQVSVGGASAWRPRPAAVPMPISAT